MSHLTRVISLSPSPIAKACYLLFLSCLRLEICTEWRSVRGSVVCPPCSPCIPTALEVFTEHLFWVEVTFSAVHTPACPHPSPPTNVFHPLSLHHSSPTVPCPSPLCLCHLSGFLAHSCCRLPHRTTFSMGHWCCSLPCWPLVSSFPSCTSL